MKEYLVGYIKDGRIHIKEFDEPETAFKALEQCDRCGVPCFELKGLIAGCQELYFSATYYARTQGIKIEYEYVDDVYYNQSAYEGSISDKYGNIVYFSCPTCGEGLKLD